MKSGCVGGKHTSVEHAIDCLATDKRELGKTVVDSLIREAVLIDKTTSYGRQVSICPEKTFEVKARLSRLGFGDIWIYTSSPEG